MIAAQHRGNHPRSPLFHSRKCRRLEYLVRRVGKDRAVLFARGTGIDPVRIGHERIPPLLAVGERLPGKQIGQLEVGFTNQRGPEASLFDTMLVPELERDVLKPLQQCRQPARDTAVDAHFIDQGESSTDLCRSKCPALVFTVATLQAGQRRQYAPPTNRRYSLDISLAVPRHVVARRLRRGAATALGPSAISPQYRYAAASTAHSVPSSPSES